jgi:hypothetical protein
MDSRHLDLAADFCDLVGKPHLIAYLGLSETATPEALQKKLKARRKYMQGMQSNPKYRSEAIFLIKNFSALNSVLATPIPYLADASRRAESQHLPVLEMTIKGVLAGGSLNYDQEDYLRRNALELGVTEATFEEVLARLAGEAGVERATEQLTVTPEEMKSVDFYRLLGVPRHASRDEIYGRYRSKKEEAKNLPDASQRDAARTRVEKAWKVLSDESRRQQYDLSWSRTGPPARNRDVVRPVQSSTAPPVQPRQQAPKAPPSAPFAGVAMNPSGPELDPPRLELLSQRKQQVTVDDQAVTVSIEVRNAGEQPMAGQVTSSSPWLVVTNPSLQPQLKQQAVRVRVDPATLPSGRASGEITITTERGGTETVAFVVERGGRDLRVPVAAGVLLLMVVMAAGAAWVFMGGDHQYTIAVDPWAEEVLIDGKVVGQGNEIVLDDVDGREATVTVRHPNFNSWVRDVALAPGGRLDVDLVLGEKLSFTPGPEKKIGELDPKAAIAIMAPFRAGMDRCLRSGASTTGQETGVVRIHVGADGRPIGFDVQADGEPPSPATLDCLRRQVAGPLFPALANGDYATVRYDYVIPSP